MSSRGDIYLHNKLVYKNGQIGRKLLILLNSPFKDEPCLFVKTTSQKKDKPETRGCIKERSLFFIPYTQNTFFDKDTWIQLHDIYAFTEEEVKANVDMRCVGSMDGKLLGLIVKCLYDSEKEDIPQIYKKILWPPLRESLKKLQEKYKKH